MPHLVMPSKETWSPGRRYRQEHKEVKVIGKGRTTISWGGRTELGLDRDAQKGWPGLGVISKHRRHQSDMQAHCDVCVGVH